MWYVLLWIPIPIFAAQKNLPRNLSFAAQARTNTLEHQLSTIATEWQKELRNLVKKKGHIQQALEQTAEDQQLSVQEFICFDHEIESFQAKINAAHARITKLEIQEEEHRIHLLVIATKKRELIKLIEKKCTEAFSLIASNAMEKAHTCVEQANQQLAELIDKRPSHSLINHCFSIYLEAEKLWCLTLCKKIGIEDVFTKTCSDIFNSIQRNNLSKARLYIGNITDSIKTQHEALVKQQHLITKLIHSLSLAWSTRAHINQELEESDADTQDIPAPEEPKSIIIEMMCRNLYRQQLVSLTARKAEFATKIKECAELRAELRKKLGDIERRIDSVRHYLSTTKQARFASTAPAPTRAASPTDAHMPVVRAVLAASNTAMPAAKEKTLPKKSESSANVLLSPKTPLRTLNLRKQTHVLDPKPPRQPFHSDVYPFQRPTLEKKKGEA